MGEVSLRTAPPGLLTRHGVVVEGCAMFPPGAWPEGREAHVVAGGRPLPGELSPVALHADSSVRAARVVALVPPRLAAFGGTLGIEAGEGPSAPSPVVVIKDADGVAVDGGALSFRAVASGPSFLDGLRADGREIGGVGVAEVAVIAGRVRCSSAREERRVVRVERRGTLRTTLLITGRLLDDQGDPDEPGVPDGEWGAYRLRLVVTAESPIVEGELLVTPSRPAASASELELVLPFDVGGGRRARFVGAGGGGRFACDRVDAEVSCTDGQVAAGAIDGARVALDPALRLGVVVSGRRGLTVGAVQSRLRALAPRQVVASRDGRLRIVLHHGGFAWEPGVAWRASFAWLAARSAVASRHLDTFGSELRPQLVPTGSATAATLPGRVPLSVDALGVPEDPTERLLARVDEAIGGEWGSLDHGDYRHPWGWGNLEYDPAAAFLLRSVAADDARHAGVARAMLDHWVLHDRSRGEAGAPVGFPWIHGREHRSLEWEAGHVWAEGLVLGALLLGDQDHLSAAHQLRRALVTVVRENPRFEYEREYAWMLLAFHDLATLGPDAEAEVAADELFDRLVARQAPGGWFRIDSARGEAGATWSVSPWVTGGITAEAIDRHARRTSDRRAAAALDRIGAFLVGPARLEDGSFARHVQFLADSVVPVAKSGRAGAVDELLISAGIGRAVAMRPGPGRRAVFEEVLLRATRSLARGRLTPNAACRALVGVRALADVRARLGAVE